MRIKFSVRETAIKLTIAFHFETLWMGKHFEMK